GPQGLTGAQGQKGDQGLTGAQGPQGLTGAHGQKGDEGPRGLTGAQGPQGVAGNDGPQGPQGERGIVKLEAADGTTIAQSSTIAQDAVGEYVAMGAHHSLKMAMGVAPASQVSMTLTNRLGNTHGLLVESDRVVLSGGTHSTTLKLDDSGASFANVQTGGPVVVSGVAAGMAPTDAVNVAQMRGVVDAAVAPLDARLGNVQDSVQRLDQKIDAVEKKLSGGVAMALALSQPVSFAPQSRNAVTGGVATYNGQAALGFSFNRLLANTDTRRAVLSLGVATTTSGKPTASARAGASFSW
ncbi:YadA-like family protein, partial [Acidovorax sp. Be4]